MPYKQETSSFSASSIFNKENFNDDYISLFKSNPDKYINKIIQSLESYFLHGEELKIKTFTDNKEPSVFNYAFCIDGSVIDIYDQEKTLIKLKHGIQIGAAFLDFTKFNQCSLNNNGLVSPFDLAALYSSPYNIHYSGLLPGKNIYTLDDELNFMNSKESFKHSISQIFSKNEIAKDIYAHIVSDFYTQLNFISCKEVNCDVINNCQNYIDSEKKCAQCNMNPISKINFIKNLTKKINNDSPNMDTSRETRELMLCLENFLVTYIIKNKDSFTKNNEKLLIVLDGRLQNKYVGEFVKQWLVKNRKDAANKFQNIAVIGAQKTGIINAYLSSIRYVLENYDLSKMAEGPFKDIFTNFRKGEGIYIKATAQFMLASGLKKSAALTTELAFDQYGEDTMVITPFPHRQEFVFTVPNSKIWTPIVSRDIINLSLNAQTNLFYQSKGALITNILAHDNVSLNRKQTNRAHSAASYEPNSKPTTSNFSIKPFSPLVNANHKFDLDVNIVEHTDEKGKRVFKP